VARLSLAVVLLLATACRRSATPEAAPRAPEVTVADVALTPEQRLDAPSDDCGLADYPVEMQADIQAKVASQAAGETKQKLSHMVLVRYRLDEKGRMTHLKLMRLSSYGVVATEQALSLLKTRTFPPTVVEGKGMPVCLDAAITIHLR
jgi:hypothetical protein